MLTRCVASLVLVGDSAVPLEGLNYPRQQRSSVGTSFRRASRCEYVLHPKHTHSISCVEPNDSPLKSNELQWLTRVSSGFPYLEALLAHGVFGRGGRLFALRRLSRQTQRPIINIDMNKTTHHFVTEKTENIPRWVNSALRVTAVRRR